MPDEPQSSAPGESEQPPSSPKLADPYETIESEGAESSSLQAQVMAGIAKAKEKAASELDDSSLSAGPSFDDLDTVDYQPKSVKSAAGPRDTTGSTSDAFKTLEYTSDWFSKQGLPPDKQRKFGAYTLLAIIAQGASGTVYKADQVEKNRQVALKVFKAKDASNKDELDRRFSAAKSASALSHPGIAAIYDVGEADGRQFVAMALVDGLSLRERLLEGLLGNEFAAAMVRQICDAMQHAHGRSVTHGDLKPANILLTSDKRPKVVNFGSGKLLDVQSWLGTTEPVRGTPTYMSPEQALGRSELLGPQSDVYSLGAILYHSLTGRPPLQAADVKATLQQVISYDPIAPMRINPAVDLDLDTITMKCLEKDPQRRYAGMQALADDLQRYLKQEPIQAQQASVWERVWKWKRS